MIFHKQKNGLIAPVDMGIFSPFMKVNLEVIRKTTFPTSICKMEFPK